MSNFGPALFGPAVFGGEPVPRLFTLIDAEVTTLARHYMARGLVDGTSIRSVKFSVGRFGYDPQDYLSALPVNPDVEALGDPIFTDDIDYWERPNELSICHYCLVDFAEASAVLGEVGIWSEIQNSPIIAENGTLILSAVGHFPLIAKNDSTAAVFRVNVNF
jgi:hypothetical protein